MLTTSISIARRVRAALMLTATAALLSAGPAWAEATCHSVQGRFDIHPPATCTSPVGVCGEGTFTGGLRGGYYSPFLTIVPTADTAATGVVLFTAEVTVQASVGGWQGELFFKEAGAFNTVGGEFTELFTVDGQASTGGFAGARGVLAATGSVDSTANGGGTYDGYICVE